MDVANDMRRVCESTVGLDMDEKQALFLLRFFERLVVLDQI